jgi:hypothetical protein
MRKLLVLALLLFSSHLSAQKTFSAGLVAGFNGCQIHGDSYSGYDQIGFVLGGFVHNNPGEKWQGQFGIQYSRKGSRHTVPRSLGGYRDFEIRLSYIDIPVIARYNSKKVFFDLGASFGYMFKARTWDANGETIPQEFRSWEFAMIAGIGYQLSDAMFIEITSHNSLLPIKAFQVPVYNYTNFVARMFNRGMYNNLLGLTFGVRFGGGTDE